MTIELFIKQQHDSVQDVWVRPPYTKGSFTGILTMSGHIPSGSFDLWYEVF